MSSAEQIIFGEKGLTRAICTLALVFSVFLSIMLLIMTHTGLHGHPINSTLAYVLAICFTSVGFLFRFWQPLTSWKLSVYFILFAILGAVLSAFILGYDTAVIYPPWTILFFAVHIFFEKRAVPIYLAFLFGGLVWLSFNISSMQFDDILIFALNCIFMALLFSLMVVVWKIANHRADRLDKSRKAEEIQRRRLTALVDSMQDAVMTINKNGKIQVYNASTLGLFDTNKDLKGCSVYSLLKITDEKGQIINLKELLAKNKSGITHEEFYYRINEGDKMVLSITMSPIKLSYPKTGSAGYSLIVSDITKRKTLDQERDEFISVISHELRTPVAIVEGAVSNASLLLKQEKVSEKILASLNEGHEQVVYLAKLLNDIATLNRSEHENVTIESVNIDECIGALYEHYSAQAQEANLALNLDIVGKIGTIYTNKLYLEEILQNLITNAIKYTAQGSVTLCARRSGANVELAVKDTGHGISKADQKKVFEKFYRSEDYRTRETGGTGLGLYVAEKLANKLGAHIKLESRLNYGSTFSFSLPESKTARNGAKSDA